MVVSKILATSSPFVGCLGPKIFRICSDPFEWEAPQLTASGLTVDRSVMIVMIILHIMVLYGSLHVLDYYDFT